MQLVYKFFYYLPSTHVFLLTYFIKKRRNSFVYISTPTLLEYCLQKLGLYSYTLLGSYLLHPKTFHPRTLILNFSSLPFILNNSSFLFNPLDFSFTNSSPPFYPTPCNLFQIICYISYPLNSYSSK